METLPLPDEALRVPIIRDLDGVLAEDYHAALAARLRVREEMTLAFAAGHTIRHYDPGSCTYLMTH